MVLTATVPIEVILIDTSQAMTLEALTVAPEHRKDHIAL
jgi:hypothetical protein